MKRRIWVPGNWEYEYDRCGVHIRSWEPGYFKMVKKKVWVETDFEQANQVVYIDDPSGCAIVWLEELPTG